MTAALEHALIYASRGWRIAPIPRGLKHPGAGAWQERASTDPAEIQRWYLDPGAWRTIPAGDDPSLYGVCVATGTGSGVFVLDVDPRHGGDETLADLEHEHGELPDTVECLTGGGGRHLYFQIPAGVTITNDQAGRLGPGLDVRGEGGQVVAPPTVHPETGALYEWEVSGDPTDGVEPAEAPAWLIELLTAEPENVQPRRTRLETSGTVLDIDRPGDRYEAETDWATLLTGDGWTLHSTRNGRDGYYELWTRPGKSPRQGASASLYYKGGDVLKVFTPSVPGLKADATYTRFGYYAATRHGGNHSAAALALRNEQRPTVANGAPAFPPIQLPQPTPDAWALSAPKPLGEATGRPVFPVHVFPAWMQDQIRQTAEELQMTVDLPSMLGITALSISAAGRNQIVIQGPWREHLNTYTVTALPPGAGKSPAFKAMLGAYDEYEAELVVRAQQAAARTSIKRDMIENRLAEAKRKGIEAEALAAYDELQKCPEVVIPRLMVEDITPEKLAVKLAEQGGRLALVSTEGGLFGMMTGRYSDGSNLDVYLQAWSGDTIRVDRVSREDMVVRRPTLTIGLTVQPKVIEDLARFPELAGRGLTARFMFSVPPDSVGVRDLSRPSSWNTAVASMYDRCIIGLIEQRERDAAGGEPALVHLSPEARDLFLRWRQAHERRLGPDGDLRWMAEWVTKLQSTTARIAGLLHLADRNGPERPVTALTMQHAIEVGNYFEAHARIAHDMWGSDSTTAQARSVIEWIGRRQGRPASVSASEIQQGLRRTFRRIDDVREALVLLVETGWLRPLFDGPIDPRSRAGVSPEFAVHPDVWLISTGAPTPPESGLSTGLSTGSGVESATMSAVPTTPATVLPTCLITDSDDVTTERRSAQYVSTNRQEDYLEHSLSLSGENEGTPPVLSVLTYYDPPLANSGSYPQVYPQDATADDIGLI